MMENDEFMKKSAEKLQNKDLKLSFLTPAPHPHHSLIPSTCHQRPHLSAISSEKQTNERKHGLFTV